MKCVYYRSPRTLRRYSVMFVVNERNVVNVTCPALRAICTATSKHSLQSSIAKRRVTVIRARFSASHSLSGTLTSGSVFTGREAHGRGLTTHQ